MDRNLQQYAVSKEHIEQLSNIDVRIVRVAPIFVEFAVGYTIGILRTVIRAMCPRNHIELLAAWSWSKTMTK